MSHFYFDSKVALLRLNDDMEGKKCFQLGHKDKIPDSSHDNSHSYKKSEYKNANNGETTNNDEEDEIRSLAKASSSNANVLEK